MHYLQTECVYDRSGLFKSIFYGLKNHKQYGSLKEVGVYYNVIVNSDNVVYYGFPELCNMPRKFMPVKAKQRQKARGTS